MNLLFADSIAKKVTLLN